MTLRVYRILFGLIVILLLGNILRTNFATDQNHGSVLRAAVVASLCSLFVLLFGFSRIPVAVFWSLVVIWEALFVWYAWFSAVSPFVIHEVHSVDAAAVSHEVTMHYLGAGAVFVLLFMLFLSLPITRSNCRANG